MADVPAVKLLEGKVQFGKVDDTTGLFTAFTTTNNVVISSTTTTGAVLQVTSRSISLGLLDSVETPATNVYVNGSLAVVKQGTGNVFSIANATGNTSIAGTLGVTGATTLSNDLQVKGNTTLGDSIANDTVTLFGDITFKGGKNSATSLIADAAGPTALNLFDSRITTASVLGAADITAGKVGGAHTIRGLATTFINGNTTGATSVVAKASDANSTAAFVIHSNAGAVIATIGKNTSAAHFYVDAGTASALYLTSNSNTGLYVGTDGKVGIRGTNSDGTYNTLITGTTRVTGASLFDSTLTVAADQLTTLGGNVSVKGTVTGTAVGNTISLFDTSTSTISLGNAASELNIGNAATTTTVRGALIVAANKNFTMTSGAGVASQTYVNSSATASTVNVSSTTATRSGSITTGTDSVTLINGSFTRNTATAGTFTDYGAKIAVTGMNLTSQTVYGGSFTATATGTTALASYGLYATASYGTNAYGIWASATNGSTNYAAWFDAGTVHIKGGNLTTGATTSNVFNTTATTLNIGGDATVAVNIGGVGGIATIKNTEVTLANATAFKVYTKDTTAATVTISSTSTGPLSLFDASITSVNAFSAATAISIGKNTGATVTIPSTTTSSGTNSGALVVAGGVGIGDNLKIANGTDIGGNLTFTGSGTTTIDSNRAAVNLFNTNAITSLAIGGGTGLVTLDIGKNATGAQTIIIGNAVSGSAATIQTPTVNFSGEIKANNGITIAADKNLALAAGLGQIQQVYTGAPGPAYILNADNLANGGAGVSVLSGSTGAGNIYLFKATKTGGSTGVSYGIYSSVTGGTSNVGGYFTASGGTNNYAIQIPAGTSTSNLLRINDVNIYSASAGILSVTGGLVLSGDLTVGGSTTTINTATLSVADNVITLNSDVTTGTPTENAGVEVSRGTYTKALIQWDETNKRWTLSQEGLTSGADTQQAIATREDTPVSTGVTYWDATTKKLLTAAGFTYTLGTTTLAAPLVNATTSLTAPTAYIGTTLTATGSSLSWTTDGSIVTPNASASTKSISVVTGNASGTGYNAGTILLRAGSTTDAAKTSNIEFWTNGRSSTNDFALQIDRANNIRLGAAGSNTSITQVSGNTTAYNLTLEASSTSTVGANGGNLILMSGLANGAGTSEIELHAASGVTRNARVKVTSAGLLIRDTANANYLTIQSKSLTTSYILGVTLNSSSDLTMNGNVSFGSTVSTTGTFSSGGNFVTSSTVSITGAFTTSAAFTTTGAGTLTFATGASNRSMTIPTPASGASDTLVSLTSTDTLTNKTLTLPKINENVQLTTTSTKLNYLTNATGTTGTDTTNIVFSTSPALTTSVTSSGNTFALFDNTATITAFAAATSITLGASTAASVFSLFGGATINGATKAITIGAAGVSGSTTNITLGSAVSGALGTVTSNQDLVVASGKNFTVTSGAVSITTPATTTNGVSIVGNSITSGNVVNISSNATTGTTGAVLNVARSGAQSAATIYGIKSAVTSTGVGVTNIAGFFSATGADANIDLVVDKGTIKSFASASPAYTLNTNAISSGNLLDLQNNGVSKFTIDYTGGISGTTISGTSGTFSGDVAVNGGNLTTTVTTATTLFNTSTKSLSIGGVAEVLNLGTTVVTGTAQTITIGSTNTAGQVTFGSSKDYTSPSNSGVVINGGVYIAKQLVVNTNLTVNGNTTLGDSYTGDSTTLKSKLYLQSADAAAYYYNIITPTLGAAASITLPTTSGRYVGVASNATGISDIRDGAVGLTSYTAGDVLYYASGNALSKLAKPSSLGALTNSSSGTPSYISVTNTNTASTIVQRDSNGAFSAGIITATGLSITATGDSASFGGNVTITGDLTVNGTTVTLNTNDLNVEDVQITLNSGATSAANSGLIINRGTGNTNAKLLWNETLSPVQVWQIDKEGAAGTMQAIATRADSSSLTANGLMYWDATAKQLVTDSAITRSAAGTISAALNGNAATASKWINARTITLIAAAAGGVTGSVSIDGSGDVSFATTLTSHASTLTTFGAGSYTNYGHVKVKSSDGILISSGELSTNFTASGVGQNGTAVTVARGDHTHPELAGDLAGTDTNTATTLVKRSSAGEFSISKVRYGVVGQADKADIRWNDTAAALEFVLY